MTSQQPSLEFPSVISLNDITEIPQFEDIVARNIHKSWTPQQIRAWQGRIALREQVRPPKFNGSIRNIEMVAMENPQARFMDAAARGWSVAGGIRTPMEDYRTQEVRGFTFTADARSSGRGVIGQVQAEIWYMGVLRNSNGEFQYQTSTPGSPVYRRMTKPQLDTEKFIELDDTARRIGFEVLQKNIMNPMRGGLPRT